MAGSESSNQSRASTAPWYLASRRATDAQEVDAAATNPSILTDAAVGQSDIEGDSLLYVSVTLSPAGAKRFERATREWMHRRMAIELDGVIDSAPVIKTAIGGGHLSISLGAGDPEEHMAAARHLADSLRPR